MRKLSLIGIILTMLMPAISFAQVFSQNQIIVSPLGSNGFVVSTTTANGAKLSATSTPFFSLYSFANASGTVMSLSTLCIDTCKTAWPTTAASSTLLGDNNTFSGFNTFNKLLTLAAASSTDLSASNSFYLPFAGGLVGADVNKKAYSISTTSMNASITGNAGSASVLSPGRNINTVAFNGSTDITINAASSSALIDRNTWSALQQFANATSTLFTCTTCYLGTLGKALNGGAFQINNIADPTSAQDAASKIYVDNAVQGTDAKDAVKFATTAALPAVLYANGSSGVSATLTGVAFGAISLDGGSPIVGDRLLIKNQVSTFQNGIYTVTIVGTVGTVFVLTRSTDFDVSADIDIGDTVLVTSGTVLASTTWVQNGTNNPVIGTDPITFAQIAGPGALTGTYPIIITGTTISTAFLLSTLFNSSPNYNSNPTISTSSTVWLTGTGKYSLAASSSYITFASSTVESAATLFSTNATTTTLGITGIASALVSAGTTGGLTAYGGSSGACTNQFPTSISALGIFGGCTSVSDSFFSGTLGVAHGGTASTTLGGILTGNGTGAVTATGTVAVNYGGTGSTTPLGGILAGNGLSPVKSVLIGTGLTFDGTTLTNTVSAGGGSYPFNGAAYNSTTTLVQFGTGGIVVNTASSTFAGIGTTTFNGTVAITGTSGTTLGSYQHAYLIVGSSTCPTNPVFFGYLEVCGNDNTTNGVQIQIGNKLGGTKSFSGVSLLNDRSDTNLTNYAGMFFQSSFYNDTSFGTGVNIPSSLVIENTEGQVAILASTSTDPASSTIQFFTNGKTVANEVARWDAAGRYLQGTTTPGFGLTTFASSTRPQLTISDNNNGGVGVSFKTISGSFYVATSTLTATSSVPILFVNPNGFASFPGGMGIASSTSWGRFSLEGSGFVHGGQFSVYDASNTTSCTVCTVDWSSGNTQDYVLSANTAFVINSTSSNPSGGGGWYTLNITQDSTGGRTVTFITPGQLRWSNSTTTITGTAYTTQSILFHFLPQYQRYDVLASSSAHIIQF